MKQLGANVRKLLPSLALGVCITVMAVLFNWLVHERRLPAMAVGNRFFPSTDDGETNSRTHESPPFLQAIAGLINIGDNLIHDAMFSFRGGGDYPDTSTQIAVIAIDENSVRHRGSWPWSRQDISVLIDKASDAKAVGLDFVFSDPDKTSLGNYVEKFEELYRAPLDLTGVPAAVLDNDVELAASIGRSKAIIGSILYDGVFPDRRPPSLNSNHTLVTEKVPSDTAADQEALLRSSSYLLTAIPVIRESTPPPAGEGFLNLFPPPNGAVRSVPLLAHVSGLAFDADLGMKRVTCPSIALEMMRVSLDGTGYLLQLKNEQINIPGFKSDTASGDRYPVVSVSIVGEGGDVLMRIPTNELGELEVGYRDQVRDYKVYPAWQVLEGRHDGAFKDKLVLIGGTVQGMGYIASTGHTDPEVSVVEAHAAMLATMLKGDFMDSGYRYDYFWQQVAILSSGLVVTAALMFGNLGLGITVCSFTLLALVFINYFMFFRSGFSVGLTLPLLSTLAVLITLMISNYLVVGRERRFIRRAFSQNVSPSILGYLESHPDRLSSLQGEHRNMSVLFTDIRGFTSISERMTAPDLALFLNEYFTPMSDIVIRNMGTVDKFIGDGLMAFWNAPTDNPRHASDAARAALDMVEMLSELQSGWTNRGLPQIAIGCGINTGPMFAGYMGSEQRKNYTVMGDNVNIASRLENLNKFYSSSILITESTRQELGNEFVCRVVDKVRVSGKQAALVIYELLGQGPATEEECEELAAFARVFELYQMREFAVAESLLKELVFIRPTPLYKMYLDRLAIYKALPPPEDWDGTFSMTHK